MKNYGLNKIFVEGSSDKIFVDFLLEEYFKIIDAELVIDLKGKDKLKRHPYLIDTKRVEESSKNLVVFDTDTTKNEGGRQAKIDFINSISEELNVNFELFLLPFDNETEGVLENLLETIFNDKFLFFDECWNSMVECLNNSVMNDLNLPAQKAKMYSKIDLFKKYRNTDWDYKSSSKYNYKDEGIWNIDFQNNPNLQKLITFI
ncbi:hypothetical protein BWK59_10045, partial [Flavobacterium davisii]